MSLRSAITSFMASRLGTRLSIGVQSFHDGELLPLGRVHGSESARHAVRQAVDSGIRTSLDLISSHMVVVQSSYDGQEAMAAFREKRTPVFEGR